MSVIMSILVTGMLVAPVFMLAGWFQKPVPAAVKSRFNAHNRSI